MHAGAVKEARVSFTAFFSEIVLYKIYKKLNEKLCKSDVAKVPGGGKLQMEFRDEINSYTTERDRFNSGLFLMPKSDNRCCFTSIPNVHVNIFGIAAISLLLISIFLIRYKREKCLQESVSIELNKECKICSRQSLIIFTRSSNE